ncbi:MAG TPA: ABC transporter permease [Thermodesulfobacteriota bacterium]
MTVVAQGGRLGRGAVASLVAVALISVIALVGMVYTPHDPAAVEIGKRLKAPTAEHPLGTDQFGRDILSRLMRGASIAMTVAGLSVAISVSVGVAIGALAGYVRGWLDEGAMRAMDGLLAFPALLLAITVVAALGPGHRNAAIAIGIVGIPVFARLTRSVVLVLASREFVTAVEAQGAGPAYVLGRHILPNAMGPVIVQASLAVGRAIVAEASLSYLGLGTQPPLPSWGKMLQEAQGYLSLAPWMAVVPGVAVAVTVLAFNLLGDALRDLLDPRLR